MLDDITQKVVSLPQDKQANMLFYLLGNLNGYFKYDLEDKKTLNKQQCYMLVEDSFNAVQ